MQQISLGQHGHTTKAIATPLRIIDRFDPDREQLAALYARLGSKRAEKRILEDLQSIAQLVAIVHSQLRNADFEEMRAAFDGLREISTQIGLVPIARAVVAIEGAIRTGKPALHKCDIRTASPHLGTGPHRDLAVLQLGRTCSAERIV